MIPWVQGRVSRLGGIRGFNGTPEATGYKALKASANEELATHLTDTYAASAATPLTHLKSGLQNRADRIGILLCMWKAPMGLSLGRPSDLNGERQNGEGSRGTDQARRVSVNNLSLREGLKMKRKLMLAALALLMVSGAALHADEIPAMPVPKPRGIPDDIAIKVRKNCAESHVNMNLSDEFTLRLICEESEFKAYRKLRGDKTADDDDDCKH
jgi:hypothetical protein